MQRTMSSGVHACCDSPSAAEVCVATLSGIANLLGACMMKTEILNGHYAGVAAPRTDMAYRLLYAAMERTPTG